jgi:hypothetical protein
MTVLDHLKTSSLPLQYLFPYANLAEVFLKSNYACGEFDLVLYGIFICVAC